MSVSFCQNLWIIYKLRYHLIEWISSNCCGIPTRIISDFKWTKFHSNINITNGTCKYAQKHMECMQSTMHVMYTNNFVLHAASHFYWRKHLLDLLLSPIQSFVHSFVRSRNHLLFDKFICLSSHIYLLLVCISWHWWNICIQKFNIIDLFKIWICIEKVTDLFYEIFFQIIFLPLNNE